MRRILTVLFWTLLLLVGAGVAYSFTDSFGARWRGFVLEALAERGIHADFERFGLHPLDGLVARGVKVYSDSSRDQILLSVDRISLDIDQGRLLEKKIYINGLDVHGATVALPLNPTNPKGTHLELSDFSARVLLDADQLQIIKAEGMLAGLSVFIQGNIKLPPKKLGKDGREVLKPKVTASERLAMVQARREQIQAGLNWMKRFSFATPPRLDVRIEADAEKIDEASGSLRFHTHGVSYGSYACSEVSAELDYDAGMVQLRRFLLRDGLGTLDASGMWRRGEESAQFRVLATADLPGLAKAVLDTDVLHEVVFYESAPPEISLDGRWFLTGPKAGRPVPFEVLGRLRCDRFNTRGEVFEGISCLFGISPEGYYVRDGLLRNNTGTLAFQVMGREGDGLRYQAALKMEPRSFLPFVEKKELRDLIDRFGFHERSSIFVLMDGVSPDGSPRNLVHSGRAELKSFTYRGAEFESVQANLELQGKVQKFTDIVFTRPQGSGVAKSVVVDGNTRQVTLSGASGTLDPVPIVACFAPDPARHISTYEFSQNTNVEISGVIATRKEARSDFQVKFQSPKGTAKYVLWGKDYRIASPSGVVSFRDGVLGFDVKGSVFGGALEARGEVGLTTGKAGYEVTLRAERFPFEVIGKDVPFENLKADVTSAKGEAPFDVSADLLGGKFTLKGILDLGREPHPYRGELQVNGVSFKKFAQIYSPQHDSEGDLTGHFKFTGVLDNWKALKGSGVTIILNGNLYALPILGPLTPLLGAILPSPIRGYNVAKEANCTFRVADGFIVTEDIEALTSAFRLVSSGSIDFLNDQIDFKAQARMRGLPGIVFRPVSQLLEFKGEGTVANPQWKPHLFGLTNTEEGRKPPTEAELDAAAREGQGNGMKEEPSKQKPRFNLFNRQR